MTATGYDVRPVTVRERNCSPGDAVLPSGGFVSAHCVGADVKGPEPRMLGYTVGLAYILDLLIGDPSGWPHPVRIIGGLIGRLTNTAECICRTPAAQKTAGVLIVLIVVTLTGAAAWGLLAAAGILGRGPAFVLAVFLAYTTLAARSLYNETWRVAAALAEDDLVRARRLLSLVVGRETGRLGRRDIVRALLETVAENLSDGVIAPLFYLALGGPPLGLAYKAVNTLDSMIGYKNDRFRHLGWAAARLDDLANFIPARLTAALITGAAWLLGLDARGAVRIWRRDGGRHTSPNAGRPEAALAGALNVTLGGPNVYHGQLVDKPFIGSGETELDQRAIRHAEQILFTAGGLMVIPIVLLGAFL